MPSDDDDFDFDDNSGCYRCGGARGIVTCIDDLCRGAGYCFHGDGEAPCPVCNKDGERDWDLG